MDMFMVITLVAMFIIVWVCGLAGLARSGIFRPGTRLVIASCVATLAMVGLMSNVSQKSFETSRQLTDASSLFDAILIPYAALALTFLLLCLVLLLGRIRCKKHRGVDTEEKRSSEKQRARSRAILRPKRRASHDSERCARNANRPSAA